ncbi:MAG: glycosyltransferase [Bacteroidetes bacterium]|nr:glycosyltransferase [Bacteroidota bacterium]
MKILMFGPGKGHNIKKFLDYFQDNSDKHTLTYFYFNKNEHFDFSEYNSISIISRFSLIKLLFELVRRYDLLWVHNWTPKPILLLILLFKNKKSKINFNVWSDPVPDIAVSNTLQGAFYRYFFRRCNFIQCSWYGTQRTLLQIKGLKPIIMNWGMVDSFFKTSDSPNLSTWANDFIKQLPVNKTKFFFPKSIMSNNRHDLIIKAVELLHEKLANQFIVYFWLGNHNKKELLKNYSEDIKNSGVEEFIKIIEHPFLSENDIRNIWEQMDAGIQILERDQLSSSFLEPLLLKKEIIATNLYPYQKFEEEFDLKLNLIANEPSLIAERMSSIIEGIRTEEKELMKRKTTIESRWQFKKNMPKMLEYFQNN